MVKPVMKIVIKGGLSGLFVGYLLFKVDLSEITVALKTIDMSFYLLSTLIALLSSFFIAAKYYLLIKNSPIRHSMMSLVKINFISRFYALFLPSAVGREITRWIKVTRHQKDRLGFVAPIIFERLTFLLVLLLCGSLPLLTYGSAAGIAALRARLLPLVAAALVLIAALLSLYVSFGVRSLAKSICSRLPAPHSVKLKLMSFVESFALNKMRKTYYAGVIGLSLIWQIFFIARLFTLIIAAALPLNLMDIVWMGSLVLLLQTLPISFAGIGLREGAYAFLFSLYGLPPENGVLIGLLFFSQMLIMAFIGALFELTGTT